MRNAGLEDARAGIKIAERNLFQGKSEVVGFSIWRQAESREQRKVESGKTPGLVDRQDPAGNGTAQGFLVVNHFSHFPSLLTLGPY